MERRVSNITVTGNCIKAKQLSFKGVHSNVQEEWNCCVDRRG